VAQLYHDRLNGSHIEPPQFIKGKNSVGTAAESVDVAALKRCAVQAEAWWCTVTATVNVLLGSWGIFSPLSVILRKG
jgi:hypothetical protein